MVKNKCGAILCGLSFDERLPREWFFSEINTLLFNGKSTKKTI